MLFPGCPAHDSEKFWHATRKTEIETTWYRVLFLQVEFSIANAKCHGKRTIRADSALPASFMQFDVASLTGGFESKLLPP